MNESDLKGLLCAKIRQLRPRYEVLRIEDHFTHGIPDISVDGNEYHSWWEAKYSNEKKVVKVKGVQKERCKKLAVAGYCRFVVYYIFGGIRRTYIVEPKFIDDPVETWTDFTVGFNHQWVAERILEVHHDHNRP